ncbi:HD domain-containing phosphohydrolase [Candidatus Latescibacterota bacterium]
MPDQTAGDAKKRILLFERDPDILKIIQAAISNRGYIIDTAKNALAFMKSIKSTPPDVIIANYEFNELPGPELIKKIDAQKLSLPVVLFGKRSDEDILNSFRCGAADYWPKPLLGDEMNARLEKILSARVPAQVKTPEQPEKAHDDENANILMEKLSWERKQLNGLLKITSSLNVSGDTKVSLNFLTDLAAEIMNCEAASIMLVNKITNTLEFVVVTGEKKHRLETVQIPLGEGIAGWVAEHGKPQIVNDTSADERFTGKVDVESGFETKKILAVPMMLDGEITGVMEVINTKDNRDFSDEDLKMMADMSERVAVVIAATRKIEDQQNFYIQTTNIIVKAIEKKDMYAEGHSWKVAEYCHKIAAVMGLSDFDKNNLYFGALLHDIGKLNLPSYIFNRKTLSERERELIRQHPVQGAKLLEPITLWKWVVPFILYHHESWDGSGYPFGKSGEEIPIGARIINLAESFTVMRASSSYKKQMTLKDSILEIMRMSGKQYDPELVKVLISILEKENWPR